MNCIAKCEYCQSFPDGYFCIHEDSIVRDTSGKFLQARDCFYAFLNDWDKRWLTHPCPLFEGELIFNVGEEDCFKIIIDNNNQYVLLPEKLTMSKI